MANAQKRQKALLGYFTVSLPSNSKACPPVSLADTVLAKPSATEAATADPLKGQLATQTADDTGENPQQNFPRGGPRLAETDSQDDMLRSVYRLGKDVSLQMAESAAQCRADTKSSSTELSPSEDDSAAGSPDTKSAACNIDSQDAAANEYEQLLNTCYEIDCTCDSLQKSKLC